MKLYSYNLELLGYLDDIVVTCDSVLGNISTISFTFPKYKYDHSKGVMAEDQRYKYIVNEAVVEYEGGYYIIKEAIPLREGKYVAKEVVCKSFAVEWSGTKVDGHWGFSPMIDHFEFPYNEPATLEMALNDLINNHLNGWRIGVLPSIEKRRTFDFEWSTPMQIVTDLAKVYDYTPHFRTEMVDGELRKYIDILDKDYGEIKGYYRHDSSLENIRIPINSDAITTRLFLFGYDNLTINDLPDETKTVNGVTYPIHTKGQSYIQNFDYYLAQGYTYEECLEKFVKVDYITDDLYVDAEDLYTFGKGEIDRMGMPSMSYVVSIKDIEIKGKPKLELGHNIRVVDKEMNIDMVYRVSKISYTSDDKENKTIEISNYATYMTELDLLTDLMVKHENLSQGAIKKYSKFAGSLVFSDNTGLTVQAPVEGQGLTRVSNDTLEGKLVRDVVKLGVYEKDKYGIQILDGQLQLDREDRITRVKIDNTDGIIIYNNPEGDGFEDEHKVFYVDAEGNLVAEKITVRNGFFYLKDGQEIEAVIGGIKDNIGNIEGEIGGINGSITEIEKEQVRLDELTKAENIINTVTQSQQYIDDLLSKVDSTVAEEESKRIEELINTATSVDRIVSTVTQSQQYINDLKDKASNTAVEQQKRDLEELINTATSAERIITTVTESDKYVNDLLEKADSATVDATINNVKNELQNNINSVDGKVGEAVLEIDKTKESLSLKANKTEVYTKAETDTALNDKANQTDLNSVTERVSTTEAELRVQADQIATKVEKKTYETAIGSINDSLSGKADTTTVNGVIERVTTAESSIVQNAEAIATKVSNTTYQQDKKNLETRMTSAESSITQNAEGIALKANKTDVYTKGETDNKVGAVSEKVSAVESSLEVQAGQISSKVSKTDYEKDMTSVGTRLSSAESSITQNADAIVQKVSKTEYAQDKKGITDRLSSAESSITQNAEAIALKASKTELTTGLSGKADNSTVTALSGKVSTVESELKVQADQIKQTVSKIEYDGAIEELQGAIDGKADSSSFTALSDRVTTAESTITQNADQIATKVSNTTYQQDKKNLETRVTSAESAITQQAESISLKANKTDVYTKAEADSAVGAVSEKVGAVESELKVQAGQITQKVSKTDYDKAMSGVNERLTTAESNITQTAESIEQKVSKTEYAQDKKGITDRLSSAESSISQQADQIALKASKTELTTELANKAENSTVATLSGKVSTVESELQLQAGQIAQKVSKTEYDGDLRDLQTAIDEKADGSDLTALAGRVTTAESSITQNANQIQQKVSKTDYDKGMAGKADTSAVNALGTRLTTAETTLTQQANSIALKANKTDVYTKSETDGKINGIEIGGRNLLTKDFMESGNLSGDNGSVINGTYPNYYRTKNFIDIENTSKYVLKINKYNSGDMIEKIIAYTSTNDYISTHSISSTEAVFIPPANCKKIKFVVIVSNVTTSYVVEEFKIKLEKGTKATDYTPAPEDIDTKVSAVEAELEVQAEQISQRVAKTDYQQDKQSMETRLTKAEASIKTTADSIKQTVTKTEWTADKQTINNTIAGKADTSTVTGINNRLTTAEGSISTLAGEVALKASKTDVYTKGEVNNKVDSIEVGGANLLLKTDIDKYGVGEWVSNGGVISIDSSRLYVDKKTIRVIGNNGIYYNDFIKLARNTTYTYSMMIYSDIALTVNGTNPLHMWLNTELSANHLEIIKSHSGSVPANTWTKIWVVFSTPNTADVYYMRPFLYGIGDATVNMCHPMLEKGNKATDWTSAPEDLIERIESAEAEIRVNADSITQTVKRTDYTGEKLVSMINQTADSIKISAKHIDINGTVSFSSFDKSTQDKITAIESTASSASSTANTAQSTANAAKSAADTAKSTANSASTTASTASTNASTALSTANTAKNTADSAKSTADSAKSTATSAQSTANSAKSVADSANGKIASWCHASDTTLINGGKIYTGSITAQQIASSAITADKIATGSITADKIKAGAITADKINIKGLIVTDTSGNTTFRIDANGGTTIGGKVETYGTNGRKAMEFADTNIRFYSSEGGESPIGRIGTGALMNTDASDVVVIGHTSSSAMRLSYYDTVKGVSGYYPYMEFDKHDTLKKSMKAIRVFSDMTFGTGTTLGFGIDSSQKIYGNSRDGFWISTSTNSGGSPNPFNVSVDGSSKMQFRANEAKQWQLWGGAQINNGGLNVNGYDMTPTWGTYSPALYGNDNITFAMSRREGRFCKVGKLVTIYARVVGTRNNSSGYLRMTLPYVVRGGYWGATICFTNGISAGSGQVLKAYAESGGNFINFSAHNITSGSGWRSIHCGNDIGSREVDIAITITYETD